ncbi:MAG: DUF302 domain-containing protein [Rhodospirillaceae bacterium]|nr:DUF302 domain-containing protein [Rhodospirillaceae bacterium]
MFVRFATIVSAGILIGMAGVPSPAPSFADSPKSVAPSGLVKVKSAYGLAETVRRLKADIAAKGITFFQEIDQAKLAAGADIRIRPSVLLVFGNPPLGTQFMVRAQGAGIDWPVRALVYQDAAGAVWVEYTDFVWIARRHGIAADDAPFRKANEVIASITSTVAK